jgi:type II secretory pathway component GspD/PulD (secretin)
MHKPSSTQEIKTEGLETQSSSGQDNQKGLEKTNVLTQKVNTTSPNSPGNQTKAQIEALSKKGKETPSSTPYILTTNTTGKQPSTEIGMLEI